MIKFTKIIFFIVIIGGCMINNNNSELEFKSFFEFGNKKKSTIIAFQNDEDVVSFSFNDDQKELVFKKYKELQQFAWKDIKQVNFSNYLDDKGVLSVEIYMKIANKKITLQGGPLTKENWVRLTKKYGNEISFYEN